MALLQEVTGCVIYLTAINSDTDILIIFKKKVNIKDMILIRLEDSIYKRLEKAGIMKDQIIL